MRHSFAQNYAVQSGMLHLSQNQILAGNILVETFYYVSSLDAKRLCSEWVQSCHCLPKSQESDKDEPIVGHAQSPKFS